MTTSETIAGQRYWLIGASSGIGAALARELQRRGAHLAISARSTDDLRDVAGEKMVTVPLDATDRGAVLAAAESVRDQLGEPDVVVWCAGYWKQFDAAEWDADAFERHVQVNLLGLNNVLAAVLPTMTRRRRGHIVGLASVAGYRGLAGAEAYGATKAAQINLFEGLRAAVSRHGVRITTVCPGFVDTPMTAGNSFTMPFIIEPEAAARSIADGLERRRTEIVFPLPMAVLMKVARLLPVRAWTELSTRMGNPAAAAAHATGRRGHQR